MIPLQPLYSIMSALPKILSLLAAARKVKVALQNGGVLKKKALRPLRDFYELQS